MWEEVGEDIVNLNVQGEHVGNWNFRMPLELRELGKAEFGAPVLLRWYVSSFCKTTV